MEDIQEKINDEKEKIFNVINKSEMPLTVLIAYLEELVRGLKKIRNGK